jgi:acetyl-CoA C-acetyltransferase
VVGSGKMFVEPDRELLEMHPHIYMPMIGTAEVVAKRYNISRDARTNIRCSRSSAPPPRRPPASSTTKSFPAPPPWPSSTRKPSEVSYKKSPPIG